MLTAPVPHPPFSLSSIIYCPAVFLSPFFPPISPPPSLPSPAAFLSGTVNIDDTTLLFEIWDTSEREMYQSLAPMYYRGAQAAIVVYDIADMVHFLCCFGQYSGTPLKRTLLGPLLCVQNMEVSAIEGFPVYFGRRGNVYC